MASYSLFSLDEFLTFIGVWSVLLLLLKAALDFGWKVRTYLLSEVWRGVDLASYGPWAGEFYAVAVSHVHWVACSFI